jgi:hypothetical protein
MTNIVHTRRNSDKEEMAMVVLVRCSDETYSVALESHLGELAKGGMISAYLLEDEWVKVSCEPKSVRASSERRCQSRGVMAAAA